ncbi:hypothetical protein PVAP13_3KG175108 [Panicum virgatum]|uniref:Uncharacterized protein n=1 Tax=Panicum virgatum TaxID=38727 RepID=A0A8T0UV32_PANVG|nr:hypothetical protein PVAP13_3KG175108 [Panicum virgatum]
MSLVWRRPPRYRDAPHFTNSAAAPCPLLLPPLDKDGVSSPLALSPSEVGLAAAVPARFRRRRQRAALADGRGVLAASLSPSEAGLAAAVPACLRRRRQPAALERQGGALAPDGRRAAVPTPTPSGPSTTCSARPPASRAPTHGS